MGEGEEPTAVDVSAREVVTLIRDMRPPDSVADARRTKAAVLAKLGIAAPAATIGRYVLGARLGSGGFGEVFSAYDERLHRDVAIKLLRSSPDARSAEALLREARAMAMLSHRNVVPVHDAGIHEGEAFVVMDLVRGETLASWTARAPRSWSEVLEVYLQAGHGLAAAHAVGLVHRDFKPTNVLVGSDTRVQVSDFGLAASETELRARAPQRAGTLGYVAPEVLAGEAVGTAADQFSYCSALRDALARSSSKCPTWVSAVVTRGLHRDPMRRWPSMHALVTRLAAGQRRRRRRMVWTLASSSVIAAVALTVVLRPNSPPACVRAEQESQQSFEEATGRARAAFVRADAKRGAEVWEAQLPRLRAHATDLGSQTRTSCEATQEPTSKTAASRLCLEQRRWALDALLRVFESADRSVVEHAPNAVSLLVERRDCAYEGSTLSPPSSEQYIATVQIERLLAEAQGLQDAGRYADALDVATRAHNQAQEVGYAPVAARAAYRRAVQHLYLGRPREAVPMLQAALADAHVAGDVARVAWSQIALAQTQGSALEDPHAGAVWADAAQATIKAAPDAAELEAALLVVRSQIDLAAGNFASAHTHARQAVQRRRELFSADHPALADALVQSGNADHYAQNGQRAEAAYREALAIRLRTFGPEHPQTATAYNNVALAAMGQGSYDLAKKNLRHAAAIWQATEHTVARNLATFNLHVIDVAQGEQNTAIEGLNGLLTSLSALRGQGGPIPSLRRRVQTQLVDALIERGELQRADALLDDVAEAWPEDHPEQMGIAYRRGVVAMLRHAPEQAAIHYRAVVKHAGENYEPTSTTMLAALAAVAGADAERGAIDVARNTLEGAAATARTHLLNEGNDVLAEIEIAAAWLALSEPARARTWLDRAASHPPTRVPDRVRLEVLRAEALVALQPSHPEARAALDSAEAMADQSRPRHANRLDAMRSAVDGGV